MKRTLSILLTLVLLCACFGTAFADGEKHITVSFWGNDAEAASKIALMEQIEQKFGVKVDYWYCGGGDYPNKLTTAMAGGEVPDIIAMANDVFYPFKDSGYIEDLKPYLEKDGLLHGTWADSALDIYTYGDAIYGLPTTMSNWVMVYNKDLFDAAGLAYPTNDWTEDELMADVRALTSGEGANKVFGFNWDWGFDEESRVLLGSGCYDVDTMTMNVADNASFKHTMELLKTMFDEGLMTYATGTDASFVTGNVGISMAYIQSVITDGDGSYYGQIGNNFAWDIVCLPTNTEFGKWQSTARTNSYMMSSKAEDKELVWEILKFMTSDKEIALSTAKANGIPTLISAMEDGSYVAEVVQGKNVEAYSKQLEASVNFQGAGVWADINSEISNNIQLYMYGDISLEEAIEEMDVYGAAALN